MLARRQPWLCRRPLCECHRLPAPMRPAATLDRQHREPSATSAVARSRCTAQQDPFCGQTIGSPARTCRFVRFPTRSVARVAILTSRSSPRRRLAGRRRRRSRLRSRPVHNGAGGGVCPQLPRNLVRTGETSYSPYEIRSTGQDCRQSSGSSSAQPCRGGRSEPTEPGDRGWGACSSSEDLGLLRQRSWVPRLPAATAI